VVKLRSGGQKACGVHPTHGSDGGGQARRFAP
jgi:hypothetical protein